MSKVYRSSVLSASTDKVWSKIRDFNALPEWHPVIEKSYIEDGKTGDEVGCVRNFNLTDGANFREKLLTLSDVEHICTYSMLTSPLPLQNYIATLRLFPVTDGNQTFIEWVAEFDCSSEDEESLTSLVGEGVFQAGFNALKSICEGL